ncbi:hypothetical protein BD413DRAFT_468800 [Trametes elegans]|nr:hypothetical protein BD413DRAFT_468800 [Trametes elegans]
MDSLVSQHPHQATYTTTNQFAVPVDAHAYPTSSAQPRSSLYAAQKLAYTDYDTRFASHYPAPSSSSASSANQHSPSLQIQTANPAPHEHEPDEQTAHPSRAPAFVSLSTTDSPYAAGMDLPPPQQSIADALTDNPGPYGGLSRPLTLQERDLLEHLDRLKFFLATAPSRWNAASGDLALSGAVPGTSTGMGLVSGVPAGHQQSAHPTLNRFLLPNQEYVSCVLWSGLYHITGTDIVRALVFRFEAFGRPVRNMKKFEEGVFSDLRNLKPGVDACLEEPKSPFLDLLFKYQCIRTQKKQKVFYWFSVPHDRLFLDALERDLKREKMGLEPTTAVVGEPALSFTYDPKRSLYEQFSKAHGAREGEGELEAAVRRADEAHGADGGDDSDNGRAHSRPSALSGPNSPFFPMFSLFEGSPTYKQRRKKVPKAAARKTSPASSDAHAQYTHSQHPHPHPHPLAHLDRFGRDVLRLSASDMFTAGARGEFGANPDLVVSQKERQRRALEVQAQGQGQKLPFVGALSGPGVAGGSAAAAAAYAQDAQGMQVVYGVPGPSAQVASAALPGSAMDYQQTQQQQPQQAYGQAMQHARPQLEQRHTYPLAEYAAHAHPRSGTDPYTLAAAVGQQPITTGWAPPNGAPGEMGGEAPRTKAFVCPLFSCGRMFKRMEHLRRHLRTHTLERPFQCEQCQKRFSRSDNLAQHVRTHDRRAASAAAGFAAASAAAAAAATAPAAYAVSQDVDMGMGLMGMAVGVPDGGEADGEDELSADELDQELPYISGVNGLTSVQMCEVEVEGHVQEVQGDEEGLLTTTGSVARTAAVPVGDGMDTSAPPQSQSQGGQEMYYDSAGNVLRASPETSPYLAGQQHSPDAQWATVPSQPLQQAGSPAPASAFSATSTVGSLNHAVAAARLDASYHTGALGDYVTSISAPSHKLSFDHGALYPAELALSGPGPIRRHRSATPSVPRYAESIRRPYSAALSDSGNQSQHHQQQQQQAQPSAAAARSYHPYAVPGHHQAAAQMPHSAQSSPMAYTVPLGYDAGRHGAHSHSRSSSGGQLQDQMRQMLSLEHQIDVEGMAQYATAAQAYAGMYRTDSPMPFSGVGEAFEMDLTHPHAQHPHPHPHQQQPYGLADPYATAQQHQQQQQQEYYPHPHHSL